MFLTQASKSSSVDSKNLEQLENLKLKQKFKYALQQQILTLIWQALLHYVTPFHWPHQYVPLLFSDRIDFVACPGIFLMGCHAMHKEKIKEVKRTCF